MNTFSRAYASAQTDVFERSATRTLLSTKSQLSNLGTLLLLLCVLFSGFAVVYLADVNRRLAIELEETTAAQNQLHLDWDKLLLEQSTWSTQARIQTLAAQQLGMQPPTAKQIVMVKMAGS